MERITVVMGVYNCASTLVEALDSLYDQTYKDFKIIICEDGSTDDTYQIAADYASKKDNMLLLKNDRNLGLNYTLNRCIDLVDTEYIARMDGDDISLPNRFEKEINFLDAHPEYALVSCPMIHFDEKGVSFIDKHLVPNPTKYDFIKGVPFTHAPCMIRTTVMKEVGGYTVDKRLLRIEDYHLWSKVYSAGYQGWNLSEPLYKMRDDMNAIKRRTMQARINSTRARLSVYKKLRIPFWYYPYAFLPVLLGLLPLPLYKYLRKLFH